jgi:hypothetical protein
MKYSNNKQSIIVQRQMQPGHDLRAKGPRKHCQDKELCQQKN